MKVPRLREKDYFDEQTEMHYALLQSAEKIGPRLHTHEFFEIFLVIEGEIRHTVNDQQEILRTGSMAFIRPDDAHYYQPIAHQSCELINLAIAHRAIEELFSYLGRGFRSEQMLTLPLPPTVSLTQGVKQQVQRKLEQLHQISVANSDTKQTALRMLLFELVTQYFPLAIGPANHQMPQWLQVVCAEMQRPKNLVGGAAQMALLSGVSPEHLTRTMRKHLGETPTSYINHQRMTVAANMLMTTDRPIVDIAAEVGIESLSHFYTLFKKHHNQTPRRFRKDNLRQSF